MVLTVTTDIIQTATAVCQVLITTGGFYLLYTTFILQAKVAQDQQKMLEIENRRARREIRPVFKVDKEYSLVDGYTFFKFYCELNDAFNLKIQSRSGLMIIVKEPSVSIPFLKMEDKLGYQYRFKELPRYPSLFEDSPDYEIVIEISFEDIDGFPYKQSLAGSHCAIEPQRPIPAW